LNHPSSVFPDEFGFWVVDTNHNQIAYVLNGADSPSRFIGYAFNSYPWTTNTNPSLVSGPMSIALDSELNIYVADFYNNRVSVFKFLFIFLVLFLTKTTGEKF
jgi:DNA-binding beta-propeller fold protein YncE